MRSTKDLRGYQKRAITKIIKDRGTALYLDVGRGKTAITLFAIKRLIVTGVIRNAIVVGPIRVIYSVWRQEAKLWDYTQDITFTLLHGSEKNGRYRNKAHIYLTNYESLIWLAQKIRDDVHKTKRFPFDMIVFDESTKIKDQKTQRFKKMKMLFQYFKRTVLATATPMPQTYMDLWSQFYAIDPEILGKTFGGFQSKYFINPAKYIWKLRPGAQDEIQKAIAPYVVRLSKADDIKLPDIEYNDIKIELSKDLRGQYRQLEQEFFLELEKGTVEAFNIGVLSMKLRQFLQGSIYSYEKDTRLTHHIHDLKLDALSEIVDLMEGRNILCAIQFKFEIPMIRQRFPDAPLLGGSPERSQAIIDRWNKGKIPLLLCHPLSVSHGLNLQHGGDVLVWHALTWSLEQYLQLNGRLHRQGQKNKVVVHHLVVNNSVDEAVMAASRRRDRDQKQLLKALEDYWVNASSS